MQRRLFNFFSFELLDSVTCSWTLHSFSVSCTSLNQSAVEKRRKESWIILLRQFPAIVNFVKTLAQTLFFCNCCLGTVFFFSPSSAAERRHCQIDWTCWEWITCFKPQTLKFISSDHLSDNQRYCAPFFLCVFSKWPEVFFLFFPPMCLVWT